MAESSLVEQMEHTRDFAAKQAFFTERNPMDFLYVCTFPSERLVGDRGLLKILLDQDFDIKTITDGERRGPYGTFIAGYARHTNQNRPIQVDKVRQYCAANGIKVGTASMTSTESDYDTIVEQLDGPAQESLREGVHKCVVDPFTPNR